MDLPPYPKLNTVAWSKDVLLQWLNYAQDAGWSLMDEGPSDSPCYGLAHLTFFVADQAGPDSWTSSKVTVSLGSYQYREAEKWVIVAVELGSPDAVIAVGATKPQYTVEDAMRVLKPVTALLREPLKIEQNTKQKLYNRHPTVFFTYGRDSFPTT